MSKDILKNSPKFTEKYLCGSLYFNKVAGWNPQTVRGSHWRCSVKNVLKNFANFTGKHLCWSLNSLNKVSGLKEWKFIKKRLQHRCFPVKFEKFLGTPFLQNTSCGCFWPYLSESSFPFRGFLFMYKDILKLFLRLFLY